MSKPTFIVMTTLFLIACNNFPVPSPLSNRIDSDRVYLPKFLVKIRHASDFYQTGLKLEDIDTSHVGVTLFVKTLQAKI